MAIDGGLWENYIATDPWTREQTQLRSLDVQRVEDATRGGRPDVEGCWDGFSFQLELKACVRPARKLRPIKPSFRPGQVPWLLRRRSAGGACGVLLLVKPRTPYEQASFHVYCDMLEALAEGTLLEGQSTAGSWQKWPGFENVLRSISR